MLNNLTSLRNNREGYGFSFRLLHPAASWARFIAFALRTRLGIPAINYTPPPPSPPLPPFFFFLPCILGAGGGKRGNSANGDPAINLGHSLSCTNHRDALREHDGHQTQVSRRPRLRQEIHLDPGPDSNPCLGPNPYPDLTPSPNPWWAQKKRLDLGKTLGGAGDSVWGSEAPPRPKRSQETAYPSNPEWCLVAERGPWTTSLVASRDPPGGIRLLLVARPAIVSHAIA